MKKYILVISTILFIAATSVQKATISGKISVEQNKAASDSVVRLKIAKSASQKMIDSVAVRIAIDPHFIHNNAHLFCDTAYYVEKEYIDAIGNVRIEQEGTTLYSDKIHYVVPEDVAQVRGRIVRLVDKENNTLLTNYLDYNTKDSVATFFNGGSMKDKDGNIIEGDRGTYDTKTKVFTFSNRVQMFSDTSFFISDNIRYETDQETAWFGLNTYGWRDKNFLSANGGRYERANEFVNFIRNVYVETERQELFCDTLNYYQGPGDALLLGNIQIRDTTENVIILGDKLEYTKELQSVLITKKPAIVNYTVGESTIDSLFIAADTLSMSSLRMHEIDSTVVAQAEARKRLATMDPVDEFRKRSAPDITKDRDIPKQSDSLEISSDSLSVQPADSLAIQVLEQPDTTKMDFFVAYHDVKIFRKDMQIICDSLIYTGLDSIARLFGDPILWNDIRNQLTSDSMQMIVSDGRFTKGNLISDAMIVADEGNDYYNQMRGAEMTGFFNEDNELYRYDILGGASVILYSTGKNGKISSVNHGEAKIISVLFKNQEVTKVNYFEDIKNNIKAIRHLNSDEKRFKNFKWMPEKRPVSRFALTDRKIKASGRSSASVDLFPDFTETKTYFPGYIEGIFKEIAYRDSINRVRDQERKLMELAMLEDSLAAEAIKDSLEMINKISDTTDKLVEAIDLKINHVRKSAAERYETLKLKYEKFVSVDKSEMNREERKEWRKEKKSLKKELKTAKKEVRREKRDQK